MRRTSAVVVLIGSAVLALQAQTAPLVPQLPNGSVGATIGAEPSGETATVTFFNRPIVVLRARVLGRGPLERARGAGRVLDDLVAQGVTGPIDAQSFDGGSLISVGARGVLALTPPDVDELSGETIQGVASQTVARLQQALEEAAEARAPFVLLRSAALAVGGLTAGLLALWGIASARRAAARRLVAAAERTVARSGIADLDVLRASRLLDFERRLVTAIAVSLDLVVVYAMVTFVLRRFPYTRPWGESMRGFLLATAQTLGLGIVQALPGVFTVVVILLLTRFLVRLVAFYFNAVERGRVKAPRWIHPETAQPTRRLLTALTWLFAIVVAYPYLPGSQTDAFKGVSVFVGLMVTLGSSGLVNHVMSGFMITYSRALRVGDFVKIGDVEGTVVHLGVLSTKIKSWRNEEITIPNAVVAGQTATDYSRFGQTEGVFTPTSVTIGYDAPWRQVHALLLMAAERTPGIRREPEPLVLQTALEDFYVRYTLWACLDRQESRPFTLHTLHANVQDLFNEHGVQIMSPNYVVDPSAPKLVARKDWFAPPASREPAHHGDRSARDFSSVSAQKRPG
jgi:small-conductance mechanosensitive channel